MRGGTPCAENRALRLHAVDMVALGKISNRSAGPQRRRLRGPWLGFERTNPAIHWSRVFTRPGSTTVRLSAYRNGSFLLTCAPERTDGSRPTSVKFSRSALCPLTAFWTRSPPLDNGRLSGATDNARLRLTWVESAVDFRTAMCWPRYATASSTCSQALSKHCRVWPREVVDHLSEAAERRLRARRRRFGQLGAPS